MAAIDLTSIYRRYKGLWVALKSPTNVAVVASGKTLKATMAQAKKKGVVNPLVMQIPRNVIPIVGAL